LIAALKNVLQDKMAADFEIKRNNLGKRISVSLKDHENRLAAMRLS
jgi:hypothetical protein